MTGDGFSPNIFFCVSFESWFCSDSFVAKGLFDEILFFGRQIAFFAIEPVISAFTEVPDQLFSDADGVFVRNPVE